MISHTGELPAFSRPAREARRSAGLIAALVAAFLVVAATASTWHREHGAIARVGPAPTTAAVVASVGRRPSHGGRYHAEVVSATPFAVGVRQTWTVGLMRPGRQRVARARLTVRSWSPETGEVSPISASVRYVGSGRYRVDGIYFSHAGWWNVALVIEASAGIDSLAFNVVMPPGSVTASAPLLGVSPAGAAVR